MEQPEDKKEKFNRITLGYLSLESTSSSIAELTNLSKVILSDPVLSSYLKEDFEKKKLLNVQPSYIG